MIPEGENDERSSSCLAAGRDIGCQAHKGQFRKGGQIADFAHPVWMALIGRHLFGCDDVVALMAALLRNMIEGTTDYFDLTNNRQGGR